MKSGGGKTKGSAFERYVCKRLSLYITRGKRDDTLWRSAMSGGRATLQLRQEVINKAQSGDLTAIAPEAYELCARCLFECKHYADLGIATGLLKGTGHLARFWADTQNAALRYGKAPVLIAKENRLPVMVLCPPRTGLFWRARVMTVDAWQAEIFLFDEATHTIQRPR